VRTCWLHAEPAVGASICSDGGRPATVRATMMDETTPIGPATTAAGAQPKISSDPAQVADDLVADEQALRDPSTPEPALTAAARQRGLRSIGQMGGEPPAWMTPSSSNPWAA
jgi:hypothetical protein